MYFGGGCDAADGVSFAASMLTALIFFYRGVAHRSAQNFAYVGLRQFAPEFNNLTGYKVPKIVEFWSELPKTNVGKVLRRTVRDTAVKKD